MSYQNKELTREIRHLKHKSFPELKWVYMGGFYVPDYEVLSNKSLARIRVKALAKSNESELSWVVGFGHIILAQSLSSRDHYHERIGIIAHEFSHIVTGNSCERVVDDEAIKRGYVFELMEAAKRLESSGLKRRPLSYSSQELCEMLIH